MAVPKRKTSKARRDKRRSSVWKLSATEMIKCSHCGAYTIALHVCNECGYYDGKQVVVKKEA
jgi:large subunit ribosomal protein L32